MCRKFDRVLGEWRQSRNSYCRRYSTFMELSNKDTKSSTKPEISKRKVSFIVDAIMPFVTWPNIFVFLDVTLYWRRKHNLLHLFYMEQHNIRPSARLIVPKSVWHMYIVHCCIYFFRITHLHLPIGTKWLYVGTEKGNTHIVHADSFTLSGYIINWNKAIDPWVYAYFNFLYVFPLKYMFSLLAVKSKYNVTLV